MKTNAWQLHEFSIGGLTKQSMELPPLAPDEVLVEVKAASINYRDIVVIEGQLAPDATLPFTPISDGVGRVVDSGEKVTHLNKGDRVMGHFWTSWQLATPTESPVLSQSLGYPQAGFASEHVILKSKAIVRVPEYLTDEQASTLPVAGLTAFNALHTPQALNENDCVLIKGTGGVSLFALQMASAIGARTIVTSSSNQKLDFAKMLGATHTINYQNEDWAGRVNELTSGEGVDRVIETVGGAGLSQSISCLAFGGVISQIGFLGGFDATFNVADLMLRNGLVNGISVGSKLDFIKMNEWLVKHPITPVIAEVYGFDELPEAVNMLKSGPLGKVVVRVS